MNDEVATFCEECGASLDTEGEGSDAEVYQDLSRANLLRIRGDSKNAIDVCLSILRRYPNNVSAHSLLGEIYLEQDDFKQASEWFEMAVDLAPDSPRELHQLERARSLYKSQNERSAIDQLEIPKSPRYGLYAAGIVALITLVAIAAFMAGAKKSSGADTSTPVSKPITIPAAPKPAENTTEPVKEDQVAKIQQDESILALLKAIPDRGNQFLSFILDPSANKAVVTATQGTAESAEIAALLVSSDVFTTDNAINELTVRICSLGSLIFVGTLSRAQFDEASSLARTTPHAAVARQAFPNAWTIGGSPPGDSPLLPPDGNQTRTGNESTTRTGTNGGQGEQPNQPRSNPGGE